MAVPTFDAASSTSSANFVPVVGVLTFAHTVGVSADLLLIGLAYRSSTSVASVTWNGSSTGVTRVGGVAPGGGDPGIDLWKVIAPAQGTFNVVATLTDTAVSYFAGVAISLNGTNQTTPVTDVQSAADTSGSSAALTINVTSNTGELVVGFGAQNADNTFTSTGTGQTERVDANSTTLASDITGATQTGASTTTHSYTASAAKEWAIIAASIAGAAGGGGAVASYERPIGRGLGRGLGVQ